MSAISDQLSALRDALRLMRECAEKYAAFVRSGGEGWPDAGRFFSDAERRLDEQLEAVRRKDEERRRRFDAVPVLQAALRFRDGSTRRVAVSKPTDEIDEPFVGEMFHAALVKQGVVGTLEAYPVLVVDRRRRVVAEIPCCCLNISDMI